jgi:putative zinc finger/helix-turn-helix YgiT family protein
MKRVNVGAFVYLSMKMNLRGRADNIPSQTINGVKKMGKARYCETCGCQREITIAEREANYTFRKEPFDIVEKYSKCVICGDDVYDEETANHTLQQLSRLYESKHSINAEIIKKMRHDTGLTQSQFAKVLNMGQATIKRYESGASLPDATQLGILKMLMNNPNLIVHFYEQNKHRLTDEEQQAITEKLNDLNTGNLEKSTYNVLQIIYSKYEKKIDNGYSVFNPDKLFNMILFFSRDGVLKTKLMKLLWYSDFLMYKKWQLSISGTPYWHKPFGPVPVEHDTVLGCGKGLNLISIEEEEDLSSGYTRMIIKSKTPFNPSLFKEEEIKILHSIEQFFSSYGSRTISDFSHKEEGWKNTKDEQIISYSYADDLQVELSIL